MKIPTYYENGDIEGRNSIRAKFEKILNEMESYYGVLVE